MTNSRRAASTNHQPSTINHQTPREIGCGSYGDWAALKQKAAAPKHLNYLEPMLEGGFIKRVDYFKRFGTGLLRMRTAPDCSFILLPTTAAPSDRAAINGTTIQRVASIFYLFNACPSGPAN